MVALVGRQCISLADIQNEPLTMGSVEWFIRDIWSKAAIGACVATAASLYLRATVSYQVGAVAFAVSSMCLSILLISEVARRLGISSRWIITDVDIFSYARITLSALRAFKTQENHEKPLVLAFHGMYGNAGNFSWLAKSVAEDCEFHGIDVGTEDDTDYEKEIKRASQVALDKIRSMPNWKVRPTILVGHSRGAQVALQMEKLLWKKDDPSIKHVILVSGALFGENEKKEEFMKTQRAIQNYSKPSVTCITGGIDTMVKPYSQNDLPKEGWALTNIRYGNHVSGLFLHVVAKMIREAARSIR